MGQTLSMYSFYILTFTYSGTSSISEGFTFMPRYMKVWIYLLYVPRSSSVEVTEITYDTRISVFECNSNYTKCQSDSLKKSFELIMIRSSSFSQQKQKTYLLGKTIKPNCFEHHLNSNRKGDCKLAKTSTAVSNSISYNVML